MQGLNVTVTILAIFIYFWYAKMLFPAVEAIIVPAGSRQRSLIFCLSKIILSDEGHQPLLFLLVLVLHINNLYVPYNQKRQIGKRNTERICQ